MWHGAFQNGTALGEARPSQPKMRAAAAFMFPVALSMAQRLHVSFLPFVVILMVGASCAFINPAGFQTNLMVQEPGGYTFADFAEVGLPLTLVVGVVVILVAPMAYGF